MIEKIQHENVLELKMNFNENNKLTKEAILELKSVFDEESFNRGNRVVLLTSAASKFFSNGLDPELFIGKSADEIRTNFRLVGEMADALFFFAKPVIAVLEGHAMAMAAVMALMSDYRFMAEKAGRIGFPEVLISMTFPVLASMVLRDLVGVKTARDLIYTGKSLKPDEAKNCGLIDFVEPAESIHEKALKHAQKMSKMTFEALTGIKRASRESYRPILAGTAEWDLAHIVETIESPNSQEGFKSITEGRRAVYSD